MRVAHLKLPTNQYGLPTHLFRPDLLPDELDQTIDGASQAIPTSLEFDEASNSYRPTLPADSAPTDLNLNLNPIGERLLEGFSRPGQGISDDILEASILPISYAEGFPTTEVGIPLWERLEFEPVDAYKTFQVYLELGSASTLGLRNLKELGEVLGVKLHRLHSYFYLYYWPQRAKAFDLFESVVREMIRSRRINSLEDEHYSLASQLLGKLKEYLFAEEDDGGSEFMEELTPKAAIDMLKFVTQTQRISAGLPANGPHTNSENSSNVNPNIEVVLRSVAHRQGINTLVEQSTNLDEADAAANLRNTILNDPRATELAQELVIKIQGSRK